MPHIVFMLSRLALLRGLPLVLLLVSGCAEPQEVLPGPRLPVEAFGDAGADADSAPPLQAAPLRLPVMERNRDAPQFEGTPALRNIHPALAETLSLFWSVDIGAGDGQRQRITADPVLDGGRIYTLDAGTLVSAVDPSGAILWQTDLRPDGEGNTDATGGGLAYAEGYLYVASGYGFVAALDAASGRVSWMQALGAAGAGRPLVLDGLVYLTAGDDTGWAIEAKTGRVAWQTSAAATVSNVLGGPSPIVVGDLVIFGFGSGEVQALFRRGGLLRWSNFVLGERRGRALAKIDDVTGVPYAFQGVIYAGSQAGRIVALDAVSGRRIWTAREGATDPVLPLADALFAISDSNELLRLDPQNGQRIWARTLPNFVAKRTRRAAEIYAHHGPVLAGGRLYIASGDGFLRAFDPQEGNLVAQYPLPGGATTRPVVADQVLYVVGRDGRLYAFR